MTVRELKEACEHGMYDAHAWGYVKESDGANWCPGGKLVTLEKRELDDVPMQVNGYNVYEVYVMVSDDE